jgi:hypothetical protein
VTVLLLLSTLVLAQDPQVFDAVPLDAEVNGEVLQGILIDEATFSELVKLRVETTSQQQEILFFEEWKAQEDKRFTLTVDTLKASAAEGQERLQLFYEGELKRAKRKDALQRHAFPLGVAVGVVASTALTILVVNAYDNTLPDSITGN